MDKGIVLITGGSGFVGSALLKYLKSSNVLAPTSNELDLLSIESTDIFLSNLAKRGVVINAVYHLSVVYNSSLWSNQNAYMSSLLNNRMLTTFFHYLDKYFPGVRVITTLSYALYDGSSINKSEKELVGDLIFSNGYVLSKCVKLNLILFRNKHFNNICTSGLIVPTLYRGFSNNKKDSFFYDVEKKIFNAKRANLSELFFDANKDSVIELLQVSDLAIELVKLGDSRTEIVDFVNLGSGQKLCLKDVILMFCKYYDYRGRIAFNSSKEVTYFGLDSSIYYSHFGRPNFIYLNYD